MVSTRHQWYKSDVILYRLATLEEPPLNVAVGSGDLREYRLEWIQPPDRWAAVFYHHRNSVSVDAHTFAVEPGDLVFFPPGSRGCHSRVDDDTYHWFLLYLLPGPGKDLTAIPLHVKGVSRFQVDLEQACARISIDPRPLRAFIWNLMWALGKNPAVARSADELYAAENYILKHLDGALTVQAIADAANKSSRQLLRSFRHEHGVTIQEFIRRKRVQEATRLLSTTATPIKEIAARVGMADLQAFNKLIRTETGLSPRNFRERSLQTLHE